MVGVRELELICISRECTCYTVCLLCLLKQFDLIVTLFHSPDLLIQCY